MEQELSSWCSPHQPDDDRFTSRVFETSSVDIHNDEISNNTELWTHYFSVHAFFIEPPLFLISS